MKRSIFIEVISFLYVLLFVYAALMKLMDYEKFRTQLDQSPLLIAFASWVAWVVPVIELIISAAFLFTRTRLAALYSSFTLMVMFTVYIAMILTVAPTVPCSCGGILESMGWTEHLIFNIAFVILSIIGVLLFSKEKNIASPSQCDSVQMATV